MVLTVPVLEQERDAKKIERLEDMNRAREKGEERRWRVGGGGAK